MLNKFFRPKLIVGTLPVTLLNGTTADATQVMSDLNWVVNQVNANAAPLNSPTFTGIVTTAALNATNITASGTLAVTGTITPGQTTGIVGTTTNNNAQAGSVGEYIEASLASVGSSLTTGDALTLATLALTAGDWDVTGFIEYICGTTISWTHSSSSLNTNQDGTDDAVNKQVWAATTTPSTSNFSSPLPVKRYLLSATTTIYLVARAGHAGNTTAYGTIRATRRR